VLPTRLQRREFIREYIRSYVSHLENKRDVKTTDAQLEEDARKLFDEVDVFRGVPGFYWGIWAMIQDTISQIDFDYASYAEVRMGEYWAWRREVDGSRAKAGEEMPVREKRLAQEA
jgi:ethanolamine kinase